MKKVILTICTVLISCLSFGQSDSYNQKNAEVYIVFFSVNQDLSDKILNDLDENCEGIEFTGKETVQYNVTEDYKANNLVLQNIDLIKGNLDGLILVCGGFCDIRYFQTGLPTLIIDCSPFKRESLGYLQPLFRGFQIGFLNAVAVAERFNAKFLTARYPVESPEVTAQYELKDLTEKINLFKIIKDLKNSTIISIQDHKGFNRIDQQTYEGPVTNYDLTYPGKLKENLGIDLTVVTSGEIKEEMKKVDYKEAEKIADKWMEEALEVKYVERSDIVRHAAFYLVNKVLLKKYNAQAISYDSATLSGILQLVYPLVIMELSKENIPSHCQSHLDCLVTSLIGRYMSGYVGFTGDFINNWTFEPAGERPENVMVIGHCGAPVHMFGHEKIPYLITDHYIGLHHDRAEEGKTPPAITVYFPPDEVATIGKIDVYNKQISVMTGTVIDAFALYRDWAETSCRNKIAIQLDRPEESYMMPTNPNGPSMQQNNTWDSNYRHFGSHHTAFYGNLGKNFKNLGKLLGFDVISN